MTHTPAPGGVTNTSVGVLKFGRTVCRRRTERLSLADKLPTCQGHAASVDISENLHATVD